MCMLCIHKACFEMFLKVTCNVFLPVISETPSAGALVFLVSALGVLMSSISELEAFLIIRLLDSI